MLVTVSRGNKKPGNMTTAWNRRSASTIPVLSLGCCVLGVGYISLIAPESWSFVALISSGVGFLLIALILVTKISGDPMNPLTIIIGMVLFRLVIPAVLRTALDVPLDRLFQGLSDEDWNSGLCLAITGASAFVIGFLLSVPALDRVVIQLYRTADASLAPPRGVLMASGVLAILGFLSLMLFLGTNYSDPWAIIQYGLIRDSSLQQAGTARFGWSAMALISYASILASSELGCNRRIRWWLALSPSIGALVVLSAFGGRVNAMMPLVLAGYVIWRASSRVRISKVVWLAVILVALGTLYASAVRNFRSGGGVQGIQSLISVSALASDLNASVWQEVSMLQIYGWATHLSERFSPDSVIQLTAGIPGQILLGYAAVRPGARIVQHLFPSAQHPWAYHTGLVVDIYLTNGLLASMLGAVLLGIVLGSIYRQSSHFRHSVGALIVSASLTWSAIWIYFESVDGLLNGPLMLLASLILTSVICQLFRVNNSQSQWRPSIRRSNANTTRNYVN